MSLKTVCSGRGLAACSGLLAWASAWIAVGLGGAASAEIGFQRVTVPAFANLPGPMAAAFGDFDGDGRLDLAIALLDGGAKLFRNTPVAGWVDVTSLLAGAGSLSAVSVNWVDYDNDGHLDLFVAASSESAAPANALYRNNGDGTFTRDTHNPALMAGTRAQSASWADANGDGWLDVAIANGGGSKRQSPGLFLGSPSGLFTPVLSGDFATSTPWGQGVAWADFDGDGDLDLSETAIFATGESSVFANDGLGHFSRFTPNPLSLPGAPDQGATVAWGDYDNDGDLDVFMTRTGGSGLFRNEGHGLFTPLTTSVPGTHTPRDPCGAIWADFDNDGLLDLLLSNRSGSPYLFRNRGDGEFEVVTTGVLPTAPDLSNGLAVGDLNGDGALDVLLATWPGGAPALFANVGSTNHWLRVRLIGLVSNRQGLGAKVRVVANIRGSQVTQTRQVGGEDGWGTQEAIAHFGMGNSALAETLRVEWPSGTVTTLSGVAADQVLTVTESQVPLVVILPPGQLFTNSVTVALRGALPGAEIRYTTNGSEPTPTSVAYAGPFQVTTHVTVKARLFLNGFPVSDVASAEFVPDPGIRIDPAGGRFTNFLDVAISTRVPGAVVRYTTNGVEPSASSALYAKPFRLTAPTVVKASAYVGQFPVSESVSAEFFRVYAWDGDGLPRAWREKFFGTGFELDPRAAADADPDADGAVNFQEFAAGTDPMDPLSGFAVGIRAIPEIRFHSVAGKKYRITRRDTVTGAAVVVAEGLSATGDSTVFVDDTIRERAGFYVVEVVP